MKISTNFLTTVLAVLALAIGFAAVPLPDTFAGSEAQDSIVEMGHERGGLDEHVAS